MNKIRILMVDDHPLVRRGLAAVIGTEPDMEIVAEAANAAEAVARYRETRPDVTLVDLNLPDIDGVELIKQLRGEHGDVRCVVLTTLDAEDYVFRALQAGALAYVLKDMAAGLVTEAIREAHRGERMVPTEIAEKLDARGASLSEREVEILELVAAGESNKIIAAKLGVVEDTVKMHMVNVFRKLDVHDRTGAVIVALRRGLLKL